MQRVCLLCCEAQGPGGSAPLLHSNLAPSLRQRCRGAQSRDVWELVSKRGIAFAPVLQPALVPGNQTGVLEVTVLVQKLTELFVVLAYRQRLTVGTSQVVHVLLHCFFSLSVVTVEIEWVHIYGVIFAQTGVAVRVTMASSGPAKLVRTTHCAPCIPCAPAPLLRQKHVDTKMQMSWYEVMHELLHNEILSQEIDLCSLGAAHLACGWDADHGQSVETDTAD